MMVWLALAGRDALVVLVDHEALGGQAAHGLALGVVDGEEHRHVAGLGVGPVHQVDVQPGAAADGRGGEANEQRDRENGRRSAVFLGHGGGSIHY
jgi:hypothetical protein